MTLETLVMGFAVSSLAVLSISHLGLFAVNLMCDIQIRREQKEIASLACSPSNANIFYGRKTDGNVQRPAQQIRPKNDPVYCLVYLGLRANCDSGSHSFDRLGVYEVKK